MSASYVPFTDSLFTVNIFVGENNRIRLPLTLRDHTATLTASIWQDQLTHLTTKNADELAKQWTDLEDNEDLRAQFLRELNAASYKALAATPLSFLRSGVQRYPSST